MNRFRFFCLLLAAAILTAVGCVDPLQNPVFYTLETELPVQEDRGLPADLNAVKMVNTGSRYFLAAGSLFTRIPGADTQWSKMPAPVAGALCTSIELWEGELWAGWYGAATGAGLGLYTLSALEPPAEGWSAESWTAESNDGVTGAGVKIGLLQAPGSGELLVATSSAAGSHALHYYAAGGDFDGGADTPLVALSAASFADAAWDSANSKYWVVSGRTVYVGQSGTELAALTTPPSTDEDASAAFGGVLFVPPDRFYLSTKGGSVCLSTDEGATWSYSDDADNSTSDWDPLELGGETVKFTRLVSVTTTGEIYVGTQGFGYYVIPASGAVTTLTRKPASNIPLYLGGVNSFLLDTAPPPGSLFVCTSGTGLWRGDYSGSDWTWKQEKQSD